MLNKNIAIEFENISKSYKLYGSISDQLLDIFKIFRSKKKNNELGKKLVFKNINLRILKSERVGIIGRNGSGKTTLLKLLLQNIMPDSGKISINGKIQSMMAGTTSFNPNFTGRENIEASISYSNIENKNIQEAIESAIKFSDLEEYLDQPFKFYSSGMQARTMFAVATAINPEILIIDEVLGAGDGYFIEKSRLRINNLVNSGCTTIIVSHSLSQILELCDRVIWIDNGSIIEDDKAFVVVKKYEEFINKLKNQNIEKIAKSQKSFEKNKSIPSNDQSKLTYEKKNNLNFDNKISLGSLDPHINICSDLNEKDIDINDEISQEEEKNILTEMGISRWIEPRELMVTNLGYFSNNKPSLYLETLNSGIIVIKIKSLVNGNYKIRYGLTIDDYSGFNVTKFWSSIDSFKILKNDYRKCIIKLNPVLLGRGIYNIGISLNSDANLEHISNSKIYDLLNKSFKLEIRSKSSLNNVIARQFHPAVWEFN